MDKKEKQTQSRMINMPGAWVIVPEEGGGYSAEVPSMPGCFTCADTWDELLVMILDAQKAWRGEPCEHHDAFVKTKASAVAAAAVETPAGAGQQEG